QWVWRVRPEESVCADPSLPFLWSGRRSRRERRKEHCAGWFAACTGGGTPLVGGTGRRPRWSEKPPPFWLGSCPILARTAVSICTLLGDQGIGPRRNAAFLAGL